jgi:transcriptional regulator with XRE-family HTH domain
MNPRDDTASNLAHNIRPLRESRGLTQQQLATMSGVPRPTWANLESGSANPTLAVLLRVAAALQVSVEELISPPRATARFYAAADNPERRRGRVAVRRVLPDAMTGIELDRMAVPPGARMNGVPHTPGTREYLTCESGVVELTASGETWRLAPGDVVVFRGDQNHSYHNPGDSLAVAYSVVVLAPAPG